MKTDVTQYYKTIDRTTYIESRKFCTNPEAIDSIMSIFNNLGSYNREGSPFLRTKDDIRDFFEQQRALVGRHHIIWTSTPRVVPEKIKDCMISYCPNIFNDNLLLKALVIRGLFIGRRYETSVQQDGTREVSSSSRAYLFFTDFWVFSHDQRAKPGVLYRQSDITPLRIRKPVKKLSY